MAKLILMSPQEKNYFVVVVLTLRSIRKFVKNCWAPRRATVCLSPRVWGAASISHKVPLCTHRPRVIAVSPYGGAWDRVLWGQLGWKGKHQWSPQLWHVIPSQTFPPLHLPKPRFLMENELPEITNFWPFPGRAASHVRQQPSLSGPAGSPYTTVM